MALKVGWTAKSSGGSGKKLTRGTMRRHFMPVLIETRNKAWSHYKDIMRPWSTNNRAVLKRRSGTASLGSDGLSMYSTVGTDNMSTPLVWLDQGTSVRKRGMSTNWQSKTWPGMGIAPQKTGRGYAAGWGTYPGIKPREFRRGIIEDIEDDFYKDIEQAFGRMCDELWG